MKGTNLRSRLTREARSIPWLLGLTVLAACGSNPGGPEPPGSPSPPPPPPPGPTTITVQQRMAMLDGVANKLATLAAPDPDSRREELLAYLRSRPEFEASGTNEDGSLWARFTDERLLLFPIAMVVDPPAEAAGLAKGPGRTAGVGDPFQQPVAIAVSGKPAAAAGPPAELPASVQVRFLSGGDPPGTPTIMPFLQALVISRGYQPAPNMGTGTIDDLMRVGGDGIFYFAGHGGPGYVRDGGRAYAVTTATRISAANEAQYLSLWNDGSLAYGFPITSLLRPYSSTVPPGTWPSGQRPEDYYGFTAKFVQLHMGRLAAGSLVYIAACTSFDPGFRDAFLAKGAGVYFGWTDLTGPLADGRASGFLFDRLLGTNVPAWPLGLNLSKENPDQRPFDYVSVYNDMISENLVTFAGPKNIARLDYKPGNPLSGLLAPSIQYMGVDEGGGGSKDFGLLVLTGKFGTDQGEVKVGNVNLQIESWEKELIKARIPVAGPQSAGYVQVWSKGRKSNTRLLTDWRPTFRWEFKPGSESGTLKFEGELRLHFRADVASYREEAGQAPKYRTVLFGLAGDSFGELEASGQSPYPTDPVVETTYWEGVASISNRIALGSQNLMDGIGEFDTETPFLRLALYVAVQDGMWVRQGATRVKLQTVWAKDEGPLSNTNPLPAMDIGLDQNFGILGALKREVPLPLASPVLFWATYSPEYPPDPNLARAPVGFARSAAHHNQRHP